MKQLKDVYEGIQFYQKDGEEGTCYGVSKDKIEKEINVTGAILIRENNIYAPYSWNMKYEEWCIDEKTFHEHTYVILKHDVADIYNALKEKYEDILANHDIENHWDFGGALQIPVAIREEMLRLIKEKDCKDDLNRLEDVYSYHDGSNFHKVILNHEHGYDPIELDFDVIEGYKIDRNISNSIYYLTADDVVIEDYTSHFYSDITKYFHVLRFVEKEKWEIATKHGYEVEM